MGKSSLTLHYAKKQYLNSIDRTIEDLYPVNFEEGLYTGHTEPCGLELMDTTTLDSTLNMRNLYIHDSHAFVLVYSITSRPSFENIASIFWPQVTRIKASENPPAVLVANKIDLIGKVDRTVSAEEGQAFAKKYGLFYIEATATEYESSMNVFAAALKEYCKKCGPFENKQEKNQRCVLQ